MIGSLRDNLLRFRERYRNDQDFRHLVRSSFYSFMIRGIGITTGFFVTILTSRFFGADALGIVSICIAILSFASIVGKLGMDVALLRYIAEFFVRKDFPAMKLVYLQSMKFIVPACLLITVVLFFSSPFIADRVFHKPHLTGLLKINSLFVLPLVWLLVNSECIRGVEKIRTYTFLQTSAVSTIATLLLLAALFVTVDKFAPISIQFIAILVSCALSFLFWLKYVGWNHSSGKGTIDAGKLLKTSSPMFITTLMQLAMTWIGTLVMAAYYSEAQVGVYNAIVRISTFTNITILAINSIASPRIASSFSSGNPGEMKKLAREAGQLIFLSSLPFFILLFLFPHFILSIFGKDFTGNELPLKLLLAGQLFVSFAGLPSQILNMTDKEKNLRTNAVLSAILNVAACFILIPAHGILGAVIAQVIGMVAWNILCLVSVKRAFGFYAFFKPG